MTVSIKWRKLFDLDSRVSCRLAGRRPFALTRLLSSDPTFTLSSAKGACGVV
jgi:hypothetical protein